MGIVSVTRSVKIEGPQITVGDLRQLVDEVGGMEIKDTAVVRVRSSGGANQLEPVIHSLEVRG